VPHARPRTCPPRPRTYPQGQGQGLDHQGQGQGQGLKICPRGHLKAKDQGQGQQHWQKRPFVSFRLQFWQPRLIRRPRFPIRRGFFGNRKFFFAFCSQKPHILFRTTWPNFVKCGLHVSLQKGVLYIQFPQNLKLIRPCIIELWNFYCQYITLRCDLDDWPFDQSQNNVKTVVTYKIKHLQKCFSVLFCM